MSEDANDVTKALAAFGAPSIRYHSFGQSQLRPTGLGLLRRPVVGAPAVDEVPPGLTQQDEPVAVPEPMPVSQPVLQQPPAAVLRPAPIAADMPSARPAPLFPAAPTVAPPPRPLAEWAAPLAATPPVRPYVAAPLPPTIVPPVPVPQPAPAPVVAESIYTAPPPTSPPPPRPVPPLVAAVPSAHAAVAYNAPPSPGMANTRRTGLSAASSSLAEVFEYLAAY